MSHEVPIWQKANLTLEEAAAYYNIGINKLRQITDRKECEKYVLWVGTRRLIKRVPLRGLSAKGIFDLSGNRCPDVL